MTTLSIQSATLEHIEGFWHVLDTVARERRYLLLTQAPPLEQTKQFVQGLLGRGDHQFYAFDQNQVVGWCDIIRTQQEQMRHVGHLGMGIEPHYRGRGLGSRLLHTAIQAAFASGIQRIELAAFACNHVAIRLYEKLGFQEEGRKKYAYCIDGQYRDFVMMAKYNVSPTPPSHGSSLLR